MHEMQYNYSRETVDSVECSCGLILMEVPKRRAVAENEVGKLWVKHLHDVIESTHTKDEDSGECVICNTEWPCLQVVFMNQMAEKYENAE